MNRRNFISRTTAAIGAASIAPYSVVGKGFFPSNDTSTTMSEEKDSTMKEVKIALIQMQVIFNEPETNLVKAENLMNGITEDFDIAVLPECFDLGWANPNAKELALPIPGMLTERLGTIAKSKNIHIVAGITENDNGKIRNTAVLIDSNGDLLGKHSKINILTDVESMYSVGTSLSVFDTKFGKIGIPICADNFLDSIALAESLARMGCDLILSPCSWAVRRSFIERNEVYGETWTTPYKAIASAYKIPVVGCSNVGRVTHGVWTGWSCIGNSIAVTADGDGIVLPFGEDAEYCQVVDLKLYDRPALGTSLHSMVKVK